MHSWTVKALLAAIALGALPLGACSIESQTTADSSALDATGASAADGPRTLAVSHAAATPGAGLPLGSTPESLAVFSTPAQATPESGGEVVWSVLVPCDDEDLDAAETIDGGPALALRDEDFSPCPDQEDESLFFERDILADDWWSDLDETSVFFGPEPGEPAAVGEDAPTGDESVFFDSGQSGEDAGSTLASRTEALDPS